MPHTFTPVSLDRLDEYYRLLDATPVASIDYSPVNLWGWQEYYGLEWSFEDNLCWIRQTQPCDTVYWAPVGDWNSISWEQVLEPGMEFIRIPEMLTAAWSSVLGERARITEERGQWEYLYSMTDLAELKGNRFHKKKNQVSGYIKQYGEPVYRSMDDKMIEDCLALQDTWCQWHNCEGSQSLTAENDAINQILAHAGLFRNLCGGSLYIDGEIVAFTLGEDLGHGTVGVHFEKGLTSIRGVYQVINNTFVRQECASASWINRAQDLDEEGLRHAKESYHPADFVRKSRVSIA